MVALVNRSCETLGGARGTLDREPNMHRHGLCQHVKFYICLRQKAVRRSACAIRENLARQTRTLVIHIIQMNLTYTRKPKSPCDVCRGDTDDSGFFLMVIVTQVR